MCLIVVVLSLSIKIGNPRVPGPELISGFSDFNNEEICDIPAWLDKISQTRKSGDLHSPLINIRSNYTKSLFL